MQPSYTETIPLTFVNQNVDETVTSTAELTDDVNVTERILLFAFAIHQKSSILGTLILNVVGLTVDINLPKLTGTTAPKFENRATCTVGAVSGVSDRGDT